MYLHKKNTEKENRKKKKMICLDFICIFKHFYFIRLSNISILRIPDDGYSRSLSCTLNLICTFLLKNNFSIGTNHLTFKGGGIYIVSPRDGHIISFLDIEMSVIFQFFLKFYPNLLKTACTVYIIPSFRSVDIFLWYLVTYFFFSTKTPPPPYPPPQKNILFPQK